MGLVSEYMLRLDGTGHLWKHATDRKTRHLLVREFDQLRRHLKRGCPLYSDTKVYVLSRAAIGAAIAKDATRIFGSAYRLQPRQRPA